MGRPLKIAKAQAVVTITATATSGLVTTNANFTNLGIIAGMPFIPASNVGNLVAGTTYWILQVVNAGNNSTFTVSETQLSANPTYTAFTLANAGPVTVAASVGVVDAYFNNPNGGVGYPATNANTYSVVGGNTAIYGSQVLCRVAIGVAGAGQVYALTSSADVWGINADFANASPAIVSGTAVELSNPVTGATTDIGFAASLYRFDANITDTYANGYVNTDDNTGFNSDKPVYLQGNIGGLVANTPYFVTTIDGGGQLITLSTSPGGANVALTADSGTVPVVAEAITLSASSTANSGAAGNLFSGYVYANDEAGFIVRQKGKQKYLVQGSTTGLVGACYTANLANTALVPNTMSIIATYANAATTLVQSLSDHTVEIFTADSGVTALPNETANINNSSPAFGTFNTAYAADTYGGQPYPIVTINQA